jgi:CRISPR system Cascade subunit CasB
MPIEVCAAIAAVLSHVKEDEVGTSIGKACGRENSSGRVPVSEIRFARLQSARTLDELVTRLRRLLPLINHSVDVAKLAMDINDWAWQKKQNRKLDPTRRIEMRWAMDYYSATDNQPKSQSGEA